jgi:hypothetical protein
MSQNTKACVGREEKMGEKCGESLTLRLGSTSIGYDVIIPKFRYFLCLWTRVKRIMWIGLC